MKIILGKIIDSQSPFHNTIVDILIERIKKSGILNEEQIKKIVAQICMFQKDGLIVACFRRTWL
jgi:hypothetical protein